MFPVLNFEELNPQTHTLITFTSLGEPHLYERKVSLSFGILYYYRTLVSPLRSFLLLVRDPLKLERHYTQVVLKHLDPLYVIHKIYRDFTNKTE